MQDVFLYHEVVRRLRDFFLDAKKSVEVPAQSRLSILAACEDPQTVAVFSFDGVTYPLPQTGQMWLEMELMKNPTYEGVFCITTSYRNEPHPIPGRHEKIFPMFEFERRGTIVDLKRTLSELLGFLGFETPVPVDYEDACARYGVNVLDTAEEERLQADFGNVVSLEKFPRRTHPFWVINHAGGDIYHKVDVLLYGMETIGSAERSLNPGEMRENFLTISHGQYAQLLFDTFGKERVLAELDAYLSLPMIPRYGGGIGITRLGRAMRLAGLL